MNLSIAQKNFIEFVLSDFLEFSADPEKLRQDVASLKEAITSPVAKEHPFYIAGDCVQDPCTRFQGLEHQQKGASITIGLVQTFIIEFMTQQIQAAALKAPVDFIHLDWNQDALIKQCVTEKNLKEPFESHDKPKEAEPSWVTIRPPGAIFEYRMEIEQVEQPPEPPEEDNMLLELNQPSPENNQAIADENEQNDLRSISSESDEEGDSDSDSSSIASIDNEELALLPEYIGKLSITTYLSPNDISLSQTALKVRGDDQQTISNMFRVFGEIESRSWALVTAILYLVQHDVIRLDFLKEYGFFNENQFDFAYEEAVLLTHRFYFDLVREKKLPFIDLLQIKPEQINILIHPSIIFLIEKQLITLSEAKSLSKTKFQLLSISTYHELLKKNNISFSTINALDDEQLKLLTHPSVVNLIRLKKLPFDLASVLPACAKLVFSNPNYMDLFMKHRTDWTLFALFDESHYKLLLNRSFVKACTSGMINFSELLFFSDIQITLLTEHPMLARWYCAGVLSCDDIKMSRNGNLLTLYFTTLATRIDRVRIGAPCQIDEIADSVESILSDIPLITKEASLLEQPLTDKMISKVTKLLQADIEKRATYFPFLYNAFLDIFSQQRKSRDSFEDCLLLKAILNKAQEILGFETNSIYLFRSTKRRRLDSYSQDEDVKTFCRALLLLLPLNKFMSARLTGSVATEKEPAYSLK